MDPGSRDQEQDYTLRINRGGKTQGKSSYHQEVADELAQSGGQRWSKEPYCCLAVDATQVKHQKLHP